MKTLHTIKMVAKDDGATVVYTNVKTVDYAYGCWTTLKLADGETATFDSDKWELWDLTPQRGWNSSVL